MAFDTRNLQGIVEDIRKRPALREKIISLIKKRRFAFLGPTKMPNYMDLVVLSHRLTDATDQQLVLALAQELQQQKYKLASVALEIASLPRNGKDAAVTVIGNSVSIFF